MLPVSKSARTIDSTDTLCKEATLGPAKVGALSIGVHILRRTLTPVQITFGVTFGKYSTTQHHIQAPLGKRCITLLLVSWRTAILPYSLERQGSV